MFESQGTFKVAKNHRLNVVVVICVYMWRAKVSDKIIKAVNSFCSGFSFIYVSISLRNIVCGVHNFN